MDLMSLYQLAINSGVVSSLATRKVYVHGLKSKKDAGMDEVLDCFLLDGPLAGLPDYSRALSSFPFLFIMLAAVVVDVGGGVGCGGTAAGEEEEGKTRVRASDHGERVDPVERRPFGVGRKTPSEKFSGGGGGVVVAGMLAGEDDRSWRQLGGCGGLGRRWSSEKTFPAVWQPVGRRC
ncbi:hypothetical protein Tco_0824697 [Tanacetum coccineum]|uniref:Uncharacterized protein n=1 Tax=Tanacetum coccineum TaxID=301880 RepID=A0ABQ5AQT6_9ASTR